MSARRFTLGIDSPEYPEQLRELAEPPTTIFGIGEPAVLRRSLGVVGARKATPYGIAAARMLAGWAAGAGYVVVSGGAVGCDQAAHTAALEAGGTTVAVMAGGADTVYPSNAAPLLRRIALTGAVISEYPWGSEPKRWTFRTRNRIIAGLSSVLLVVEASVPSGTFSTVDYAMEAGRTVAAVPGSVFAWECRGPNRLLRQGAVPITEPSDLALLLEAELGPPVMQGDPGESACASNDDPLLQALLADPMRPDDAAYRLGMDIISVVRRIGTLEGEGRIARYPDGRYGPC